jgi:hypothetical protein
MNASEAEAALDATRRLLQQRLEERQFGPEYRSLQEEVLRLERVVAETRGEPFVLEAPVMDAWPGMAHFTAVIGDSFHCTVLFATPKREHVALRFMSIAGYKVTGVSDEIIEGHPLTGRGLTAYRTFVVNNSPWLKELESTDSVHPNHRVERWRIYRHYLLCFKDRMFEAIAENAEHVGTFKTVQQALDHASAQVTRVVS